MFSSGNGGRRDDCGADSYDTSIYTISVGAVSVTGEQSSFDERCSAKMVVNYVTDVNNYSAVVCPALPCVHTCVEVRILLHFRVQQTQMDCVPHHLVEQVLQLQWQLQSLLSL